MIKKNTPYVKQFENGILTNPITKENPYLNNADIRYLKPVGLRIWRVLVNKYFIGKTY